MKGVLKSLDEIAHVEEKGRNVDSENVTIQNYSNPIEVKTYSEVAVQTMDISSEHPTIN